MRRRSLDTSRHPYELRYDAEVPDYGRGGRPIADENEARMAREHQRDMARDAEMSRMARRAVGPGWWSRVKSRLRRRA